MPCLDPTHAPNLSVWNKEALTQTRVGWSVYVRRTRTVLRQGCHYLISLQACNFSVIRNVTRSGWGQQNHRVPSGTSYLSLDLILSWRITSWEDLSSKLSHPFPCHIWGGGRGRSQHQVLIFSSWDQISVISLQTLQCHSRGEPHMSSWWLCVLSPQRLMGTLFLGLILRRAHGFWVLLSFYSMIPILSVSYWVSC